MSESIHSILKQYWGYETFRPLQEDIINSILSGKDTLALLPTGGGKSICFQVPAMKLEGVCLVISPLIALMKDQVEQLQKRNIPAAALYSGMSRREQKLIIDNAQNDAYKFLYVSPERLKSTAFRERLEYIKVCLIAVDEAHCISQWGYDFRPEYLLIAEIRDVIKSVPILALTASATTQVVNDIQRKLSFKTNNCFSKSFVRNNLSYVVNTVEDKLQRMLHILNRVKGSGLIYVRNRKNAQDIATFLLQNKISADYYHAGLSNPIREKKQDNWIHNHTRIMVCTNAFGMGIDKPDCRVVIHYEMPESIESYYQEAGRAGRDEKRAYCVLLFHDNDKENAQKRLELSFPDEKKLKQVYQALCNYYGLPIGALPDNSFDFDINEFCQRFALDINIVYPALKLLQQCEWIELTESFFESSKFKFIVSHEILYKFQVENQKYDDAIKLLLRSYGGLFDTYVTINEQQLAKRYNRDKNFVIQFLNSLTTLGLADYQPQKDKPQLQFTTARVAAESLSIKSTMISQRKDLATQKLNAMIGYATNKHVCRSKVLVEYFNEFTSDNCGLCDICIENKKADLDKETTNKLEQTIKKSLINNPIHLKDLINQLEEYPQEKSIAFIRHLIDIGNLQYNNEQKLFWTEKE